MSFAKSSLAAAALAALAAASAEAGTVTGATGAFRVNGKDAALEPGKTLALKKGDTLDTAKATVTYRSDTGDTISVEPDSVVREEETTEAAAGLFLLKGAATGTLSEKTHFGAASGWATAPKGGRTKVLVETTAGKENVEAQFRSIEGAASVTYHAFTVVVLPAHSVTIDIVPGTPGSFYFRTGQQNPGEVEVRKSVPGGDIIAWVPKATLGYFIDEPDNKTKVCDDLNSLKTAKIRLQTRFTGRSDNTASIGPGTCAVIDNTTGAITLLFAEVKYEILERALSLTSEFSTLTQSNFSDVK